MNARLTVRALAVLTIVAVVATLLGGITPAPAAAVPASLVRPLSVQIDTMASCGSSPGILVTGPEANCYARTSSAGIQVLVLDRATTAKVSETTIFYPTGAPHTLLHDALKNRTSDQIVVLSAPNGTGVTYENTDLDLLILRSYGIDASCGLSAPCQPFSLIGVPQSGAFPGTMVTFTANANRRVGTPEVGVGQPGQIQGYLAPDSRGTYAFVDGEYVPFTTMAADAEPGTVVFQVGDRSYATNDVAPGQGGVALLVVDGKDLRPIVGPVTYLTNSGDPAGDQARLLDLARNIDYDDGIALIQTVGTPVADRPGWESVAQNVAGLGGTAPYLTSIGRPDFPGSHIPRAYAFAGLADNSDHKGLEAISAPMGQPVRLQGVLWRGRDSRFRPLIADSTGGVDGRLMATAYQPGTPWPRVTDDDASIISYIHQALIGSPVAFPSTPGLGLRDAYWTNMNDANWPTYLGQLVALNAPAGVDPSDFEAVQQQLAQEFGAVLEVHNTLVDAGGMRGVLEIAQAAVGGTLDVYTQALIDGLARRPQGDEIDILGAVTDGISAALAFAGAFAGPAAAGPLNGASVIMSMASTYTPLAGVGLNGEQGDFDRALQVKEADLGQALARQYQEAILNAQQIARIIGSDYGKLTAAANAFSTQPEYDFSNAVAVGQASDLVERGARQQVAKAIFGVAYGAVELEAGQTIPATATYRATPGDCFNDEENQTPGSTQTVVGHLAAAQDGITAVPRVKVLVMAPKNPDKDDTARREFLRPWEAQALFAPSSTSVTFPNGLSVPAAGFDPMTFVYSAPRIDGDCSSWFTGEAVNQAHAPGALVSPWAGNGQHVGVDTTFDPLVARLTDGAGNPVAAAESVQFTAGDSGEGPGATYLGNLRISTGPTGLAQSGPVVANGVAGNHTVEARAVIGQGTQPIPDSTVFHLANDRNITASVVAGGEQYAKAGTRFAGPLTVEVRNDGQPAGDRTVVLTTPASGPQALFGGLSHRAVLVTDAFGRATTSFLVAGAELGDVPVSVHATGPLGGETSTLLHVSDRFPATVKVSSSKNPSTAGDAITLRARVRSSNPFDTTAATGTVQFAADGIPFGEAVALGANGSATSPSIDTLGPGQHTITATYSGDGNYSASTGEFTQTVEGKWRTTTSVVSSANPSVTGQAITLTAKVGLVRPASGTPTGTVAFADADAGGPIAGCEAVAVAQVGTSFRADCPVAYPAAGAHEIVATYSGDDIFWDSTSEQFTQHVAPASTAVVVTSSAMPAGVNQPVDIVATVRALAPGAGSPTGAVSFWDGATRITGCEASEIDIVGQAVCTTTFSSTGGHQLAAMYAGNVDFQPSMSATFVVLVERVATTTSVTSAPNPSVFGHPVTITASVATDGVGRPSGIVEFYDRDVLIGFAMVATDGPVTASMMTSGLRGGGHVLTARYRGDTTFAPSDSAMAGHVVTAAATRLVAEPAVLSKSFLLTLFRLSATLTRVDNGQPVGGQTVFFSAGSTQLCSAITDGNGVASCSGASGALQIVLQLGYTASFHGNADYSASRANGTVLL